ncbi:MAG: hypothetical protein J0L73_00680 [Verrucomicrobia bacterium]|nr:hypothetical protein [Verrucomicrobiota bacterium]
MATTDDISQPVATGIAQLNRLPDAPASKQSFSGMSFSLLLSICILVGGPFVISEFLKQFRASRGKTKTANFLFLMSAIVAFVWLGVWDGWRLLRVVSK